MNASVSKKMAASNHSHDGTSDTSPERHLSSEDLEFGGSSSNFDEEAEVISIDSSKSGSNGLLTAHSVSSAKATNRISRNDPGIRRLRIVVFLVLFGAGALVCAFVFWSAKGTQTAEFELRWEDTSSHIGTSVISETASKLRTIDAFAITVQSHALLNKGQIGASWPLVHLPEFAYRSASVLINARAESISLMPRVEANEKRMWEFYSEANQDWRAEGIEFQKEFPDALSGQYEHGDQRLLQLVEDMSG